MDVSRQALSMRGRISSSFLGAFWSHFLIRCNKWGRRWCWVKEKRTGRLSSPDLAIYLLEKIWINLNLNEPAVNTSENLLDFGEGSPVKKSHHFPHAYSVHSKESWQEGPEKLTWKEKPKNESNPERCRMLPPRRSYILLRFCLFVCFWFERLQTHENNAQCVKERERAKNNPINFAVINAWEGGVGGSSLLSFLRLQNYTLTAMLTWGETVQRPGMNPISFGGAIQMWIQDYCSYFHQQIQQYVFVGWIDCNFHTTNEESLQVLMY